MLGMLSQPALPLAPELKHVIVVVKQADVMSKHLCVILND